MHRFAQVPPATPILPQDSIMKIAFVGCGDRARKRLELLRGQRAVFFVDTDRRRAESLASPIGAAASTDWRDAADYPEVDVVFVCTPRDKLAAITMGCVQAGKHVFVEQPAAAWPSELVPIISAINERGVFVRVGFPLRYQPATLKARLDASNRAHRRGVVRAWPVGPRWSAD